MQSEVLGTKPTKPRFLEIKYAIKYFFFSRKITDTSSTKKKANVFIKRLVFTNVYIYLSIIVYLTISINTVI